MSITKEEALNRAKAFLLERKFDVADFQETIVFQSEKTTQIFLEQEVGSERSTILTTDSVCVWFWSIRLFKPLDKLEYYVRISSTGNILGFKRILSETSPGFSIEGSVASILTEAFLVRSLNLEMEDLSLVESFSTDRELRRDHSLTYEIDGSRFSGASIRIEVNLQGAEIGGFNKYLDIPQSWIEEFEKQRSQNDFYQNLARLLSFLTVLLMLFNFFTHAKHSQIPWKTAAILGSGLTILNIALSLNSLPLIKAGYITTESYSAFLSKFVYMSILDGVLQGLWIFLLIGAGEALYRNVFPGKLSLPNIFTRKGIQTREFFEATLMGYILVAISIGFVVVYYVLGRKFGFWAPSEVKYSNALSTSMPWIFPLVISAGAALTEEFWFRLWGISFFKKHLKSTFLAILIPAIIWGFLHSTYPQHPGFARGIEVTMLGIMAGAVMMRFGVWAVFVWHFVLDSIWIGLFLFQSENSLLKISGLIVCCVISLPAVLAAVQAMRGKKFLNSKELINSQTKNYLQDFRLHIPFSKSEKQTRSISSDKQFKELSSGITNLGLLILICLILGFTGFTAFFFSKEEILDNYYSPGLDRQEALSAGLRELEEKYEINQEDFLISIVDRQHLKQYDNLKTIISYISKYGSFEDAKELIFGKKGMEYFFWLIELKREFETKAYYAKIDQISGEIYTWCVLPDSSVGAELEADSALTLATGIFEREESEFEKYQLTSNQSRQRSERIDHYLTWETIEPVIGEAFHRRSISIKGDEVIISGGRELKLPEHWIRHEEQKDLRWILIQITSGVLLLAGLILSVLVVRGRLTSKILYWRKGAISGGAVFLLSIIEKFNQNPVFWWKYNTSIPANRFITSQLISDSIEIVMTAFMVFVLISLTESLSAGAYRKEYHLPKKESSRNFTILFGFIGAYFTLQWVLNWISLLFNLPEHGFPFNSTSSLAVSSIWMSEIIGILIKVLPQGSIIILTALILRIGITSSWIRLMLIFIISVCVSGYLYLEAANPTTMEFSWSSMRISIMAFGCYYFLGYCIHDKFWLFLVGLFSLVCLQRIRTYLEWSDSPYYFTGVILACTLGIILIFYWFLLKRRNLSYL